MAVKVPSAAREQDLGEQGSWDSDLRKLERDVVSLANHFRANLDAFVGRSVERPLEVVLVLWTAWRLG
jgi:hypothetical protein